MAQKNEWYECSYYCFYNFFIWCDTNYNKRIIVKVSLNILTNMSIEFVTIYISLMYIPLHLCVGIHLCTIINESILTLIHLSQLTSWYYVVPHINQNTSARKWTRPRVVAIIIVVVILTMYTQVTYVYSKLSLDCLTYTPALLSRSLQILYYGVNLVKLIFLYYYWCS